MYGIYPLTPKNCIALMIPSSSSVMLFKILMNRTTVVYTFILKKRNFEKNAFPSATQAVRKKKTECSRVELMAF